MKIVIAYFSQSGNTKKVADRISLEMESRGNQVVLSDIGSANKADILECDLLGIGSPTFESHCPEPVGNFIKQLPEIKNKKSFIFATCGGAAGNIISDIKKGLKRKGATYIGSFLTLGEIYHPAPSILGISKNRPNVKDLDSAGNFAREILKSIDNPDSIIEMGIIPKKGFYNLVGNIASSKRLVQFLVPEPVLNRDKCKKCKLCVKECPVESISMEDFPEIDRKCIRCYNCVNICSSTAYSVNWWFGDKAISILWNRTFMAQFGEYQRE